MFCFFYIDYWIHPYPIYFMFIILYIFLNIFSKKGKIDVYMKEYFKLYVFY